MMALLALLYLYVLPKKQASEAKAQSPELQEPLILGSSSGTHPLAKHYELSGVRVRESAGGKVRVAFVVTNHSGASLPPLRMDIRLSSGNRDFFTFPVELPALGPYESRDLASNLKTDLKPYEMPDWQLLRPQFTILTSP